MFVENSRKFLAVSRTLGVRWVGRGGVGASGDCVIFQELEGELSSAALFFFFVFIELLHRIIMSFTCSPRQTCSEDKDSSVQPRYPAHQHYPKINSHLTNDYFVTTSRPLT